MIGREYNAVFPARTARAASDAAPLLEVRHLELGRPAERHLAAIACRRGDRPRRTRRPGPARAAARALRRAARHDGRGADRWQARHHHRSARREAQGDRHGADPRGPQDRGPDAADVGARQPLLRGARPPVALGHRRQRRPSATRWSGSCGCSRCAPTAPTCRPGSLSGGNQQKVVIGKWLMMAPRILLLNDPTRGIDVGTKQEMYQLLRELAERRRGDPLLLDRLRRAHRLLRPRARDVRRRDQARAGRRGDHRARAGQQRAEHRRRKRAAPAQPQAAPS